MTLLESGLPASMLILGAHIC